MLSFMQKRRPELYKAMESGDAEEVKSITSGHFCPRYSEVCRGEYGEANLLVRAKDNVEILQCLFEVYGKDISWYARWNAFECAAKAGYTNSIPWLFKRASEAKNDGDIISNIKQQALRGAVEEDRANVVEMLLEIYGTDPDASKELRYAVGAVGKGCVNVVGVLLDKRITEIDEHTKFWAVNMAAMNGDLVVLNRLLEDASIVAVAARENNEPLRRALNHLNRSPEAVAKYQPIVDRLRQIPAVAQLEAQMIQQGGSWEDINEQDKKAVALFLRQLSTYKFNLNQDREKKETKYEDCIKAGESSRKRKRA